MGGLRSVPGLRSYVEIDLGGPVSFGLYSYITDAFRLLGSPHVYEERWSEWLRSDFAWVRDQDPDVIVYEPKMFSGASEGDVARIIQSRRWEGLKAAKLRNVFVAPGPLDFLAHHGPSFITQALPWLEGRLRMAKEKIES